jgi:putative hydrolase of the HAD superfamily
LPPTRILSFDLDDTLWPVAPVIAGAEQALFEWLHRRHPATVRDHGLEAMRAARTEVAERFPERVHDLTFLRRQALVERFAATGHDPALADEALEVFLAARNRVELYPDVRPALTRLRLRHRLYALSNGNAELGRCGLAEYFAGHVTAREAGAAKPDARIFALLLARAGVSAAEVLHVGDDPLADVVGARSAGIRAIWLNRAGRAWPAQYPPPARTLTTLDDLDEAVAANDGEC